MPTRTSMSRLRFATVLVAALTAAAAATADAKEPGKPPRQMLGAIFGPICRDLGALNTQKATLLSGPTAVKMHRGRQPGKQWRIGLGRSKFKITIRDTAPKDWTVQKAMKTTEELPVPYRRCLEIISEGDKDGLAYYPGLGGAHGGQNYINVEPGARSRCLVHEAGHCFDQRARDTEPDLMKRWAAAVKADDIGVSGYGDSVVHEDMAEFARVYAYCIDYAAGRGMKDELRKLSPERFKLWERILHLSKALPAPQSDVEFGRSDAAARKKQAEVRAKMKPRIARVRENIKAVLDRRKKK